MKGIVFTEFLEMVESQFSIDMAEQIIEMAQAESGGVYTSVGTYDHAELVSLVVSLSQETSTPISDLLNSFGKHLFQKFLQAYPAFFTEAKDAFDLLERVDGHIHVEVKKLYPDAELPKFETRRVDANQLEMIYTSSRHFEDLAEGLIDACVEHYAQPIVVRRSICSDGIKFELTKVSQ